MDTSMHGVEVLFPDFRLPQESLTPEDWTSLAFKLHAELSGFTTGTDGHTGSIPWLLENANPSLRDKELRKGHPKILPQFIDDSGCEKTTKGARFVSTIEFGKYPSPSEWLPVNKEVGKRVPRGVDFPKARRTVHLLISAKGFLIVIVRWKPFGKWEKDGGYHYLTDYGFYGESIVVIEAGPTELTSFFKNHNKTSTCGSWGSVVVNRLLHIQEDVTQSQHAKYREASNQLERIRSSVRRLARTMT